MSAMLSERKKTIRCAEVSALVVGLLGFVGGISILAGWLSPSSVRPILFAGLVLVFVCVGMAAALISEFEKTCRAEDARDRPSEGLSLGEILEVVRWCPRWISVASIAFAIVMLAMLLPEGEIIWDFAKPLSQREALGACFTFGFLSMMVFPVLASASRMRGSYEANLVSIENGT